MSEYKQYFLLYVSLVEGKIDHTKRSTLENNYFVNKKCHIAIHWSFKKYFCDAKTNLILIGQSIELAMVLHLSTYGCMKSISYSRSNTKGQDMQICRYF